MLHNSTKQPCRTLAIDGHWSSSVSLQWADNGFVQIRDCHTVNLPHIRRLINLAELLGMAMNRLDNGFVIGAGCAGFWQTVHIIRLQDMCMRFKAIMLALSAIYYKAKTSSRGVAYSKMF